MKVKYNTTSTILLLLILIACNQELNSQKSNEKDSASCKVDSALIYGNNSVLSLSKQDSIRSIEALKREIDGILAGVSRSSYSIAIYSLNQNKFFYAKNYDMALTPASTTKMITAFSLMHQMKGDYYVKTEVFIDGPIHDGVLEGNIYIYGRGDCLLTVPDLEYLADKVKQKGIVEIRGGVFADPSFFDGIRDRAIYSGDNEVVQGMPPVSALGLDFNTATVRVTAGTKPGAPLFAQVIPSGGAFRTSVQGVVRAGKRNVRVNSKTGEDGIQNFIINGSMGPKQSYMFHTVMTNPELAVAGNFKERLEAGGIKINGGIGIKKIPEITSENKIATFGRPVFDLFVPLNKNSNNYVAEHMFKMIGAYNGNHTNNYEGAQKAFAEVMDTLGVPCDLCNLNDGSGLSRRNRLSALTLLRMLKLAHQSPWSQKFEETLAIAGVDGTLVKRMRGTKAEGNVRAKTGTLNNVSALAGYVNTLDGEKIAFAMIFNGGGVYGYKNIENQICVALSNFFYFNSQD